MSDGTYTRAPPMDYDSFTLIPITEDPAAVEGGGAVFLYATGPPLPLADGEFDRLWAIYGRDGLDALATELEAMGFRGCSERDGKLVAWGAEELPVLQLDWVDGIHDDDMEAALPGFGVIRIFRIKGMWHRFIVGETPHRRWQDAAFESEQKYLADARVTVAALESRLAVSEGDAAAGVALANDEEVRVGCLWLFLNYPEGESPRLGLCLEEDERLSKEGALSFKDVESLKQVLASFLTNYRAKTADGEAA